jgi:hypothetical protein
MAWSIPSSEGAERGEHSPTGSASETGSGERRIRVVAPETSRDIMGLQNVLPTGGCGAGKGVPATEAGSPRRVRLAAVCDVLLVAAMIAVSGAIATDLVGRTPSDKSSRAGTPHPGYSMGTMRDGSRGSAEARLPAPTSGSTANWARERSRCAVGVPSACEPSQDSMRFSEDPRGTCEMRPTGYMGKC